MSILTSTRYCDTSWGGSDDSWTEIGSGSVCKSSSNCVEVACGLKCDSSYEKKV